MKKLYLYGFTGVLGASIKDELEIHYNIVGWLSDNTNATENIWNYLFDRVLTVDIMDEAINEYETFYNQHFLKFMLMVQRRGLFWKDFFEIRNEFNTLYYNIYHILKNRDVEVIIFSNLPHEGPDYIFYSIAKLLNIETILFYQSIFKNKAFVLSSLSDFGSFELLPLRLSDKSVEVNKGHNEKLFYMEEVEKKRLLNKENFFFRFYINSRNKVDSVIKKIINIPNYRWEKEIFRNIFLKQVKVIEDIKYRRNLKKASKSIESIDFKSMDKKLIYIPLHLQPELTTTAIGGLYEDQLVMIETLSIALGDKGLLLVKENPKQTAFQRNKNFFKRLSKLENVYLVESTYPSNQLIEMCHLVATVSGTAGWEAIKGGKQCLVFGQAWYQKLPGCYSYSPTMNIYELIEKDFMFDFEDFQEEFDKLMYKCIDAVVDSGYISQVNNFEHKKNASILVSSMIKVIDFQK